MVREGSSSSLAERWLVSYTAFVVAMWTLCGVAHIFLASRFAVRLYTKGKLMVNDYFLLPAIPALIASCSLLQTILRDLYISEIISRSVNRLPAAIDLLWVAIYCVKFCFLAQFQFYRPPYAYVVAWLTRYYWMAVGICSAGFIFTIVQPIVLCSSSESCRYTNGANTVAWEIAVSVLDIIADVIVVSIPALLVKMANFVHSHTVVNFVFKSLSLFNIAVAGARLGLQYGAKTRRIQYVSVTFLLVIEATIALIMVSISGYRIIVLDRLADWEQKRNNESIQLKSHHIQIPEQTSGGISETPAQ